MSATTASIPSWVAPSLVATPDLCTLQTCPISMAHFTYLPSIPGNVLYAAIFGLCLVVQLGLCIRYRIWGFLAGMVGGLVLEIVGYIARIMMHSNPFLKSSFLMYLICLTIGPAFLSGSVYLCLARIVVAYGQNLSRFTPRFYTITFITFDIVALLLQAAGGAIASGATTASTDQMGINIMVAGVGWQVASLGIFAILCAEFGWRVHRAPEGLRNPNFAVLRRTFRFKAFLWTLGLAALAIFVRSVFRCAELSGGFHGKLAQQQITFMILEGAMITSAVLLLTIFHPGLSFQGKWNEASWSLGKKGKTQPKQTFELVPNHSAGSKWTDWMPRKKKDSQMYEKAVDVEQAST